MWQEAEGESINMQNQIDALKEEKERLLNSLVEAEWVNKFFFYISCVLHFYLTQMDRRENLFRDREQMVTRDVFIAPMFTL